MNYISHTLILFESTLSTFSLMIIPIVRGGRGFKNVDNYHTFLRPENDFDGQTWGSQPLIILTN